MISCQKTEKHTIFVAINVVLNGQTMTVHFQYARYVIGNIIIMMPSKTGTRLKVFMRCETMDLLKPEQIYHLSCPSCGKDWWDDNPFPSYCPYCNTNRIPERKDKNQSN